MKRYRVTKTGKKAIYIISFVIIFSIINFLFKVVASAENMIKQINGNNTKIVAKNTSTQNSKIDVTLKDIIKATILPSIEPAPTQSPESTEMPKVNKEIVNLSSQADEPSYDVEKAYTNDGKKVVFLTFDDGPSTSDTQKILDVLDKYKIKATFFVVGTNVEKNKDQLKAIFNDGHAIGNHSYTHNYRTLYADVTAFDNEVTKTTDLIKSVLGEDFNSRLFRFPGGAFEVPTMKPFKDDLISKGYVYIDWNAINGDGEENYIPIERLISSAEDTIGNQKHVVLLMHDGAAKETTVGALPQIIEYLKEKGYIFATLK